MRLIYIAAIIGLAVLIMSAAGSQYRAAAAKVAWSREVRAELQAEYLLTEEQAAAIMETVLVHDVEVDGVWYTWKWCKR